MTNIELKKRVLDGMGLYRARMESVWGDDFSTLVDYLAVATAPLEDGIDRLSRDVKKFPNYRTVVIGDEYSAGRDPTGRDNAILLAAAEAANILSMRWKPKALRNFRQEDGSFSIVFSGAVRGVERFGEFTGSALMRQFNDLTNGAYAAVTLSIMMWFFYARSFPSRWPGQDDNLSFLQHAAEKTGDAVDRTDEICIFSVVVHKERLKPVAGFKFYRIQNVACIKLHSIQPIFLHEDDGRSFRMPGKACDTTALACDGRVLVPVRAIQMEIESVAVQQALSVRFPLPKHGSRVKSGARFVSETRE